MSYRALFDLKGKTALITGGAGIIGRACCDGLAEMGASVAVVDIDGGAADEVAKYLAKQHGGTHLGVGCDLRDPEAIGAAVELTVNRLGGIDVLHNNAATKGSDLKAFLQPVEGYAIETWRDVMAVNVDAMFLMARAVVDHMIATSRRGSIIQTGSIYGAMAPDPRVYEGSFYEGHPIDSPAVYAASKAAVLGLTRYFATYWAPHGIRVNAICPGGVDSGQNDTFRTRYSARVPLGRMARSEEMVGALLYLASDASSYVTGQVLMVDGGLSAW